MYAMGDLEVLADDALWYKDAVFYELFVRAFADGDGDGIGDLRGLTARLDYLQWLGVDVLWLLPIFPSPLRDDGYDVSGYCDIHPDYGTLEDFRALMDEAHRRGLRVVVELIANHTSDQHPWFQASRDPAHPNHEKYRDWYVWSTTDQKYRDARIIFLDSEPSNWTYDPVRDAYFWHRFFHHQPDLNYDNPGVQRAMLRTVQFWMDLGVDGFRADATPYLYERDGTSCENLPETHGYLRRVRAFVEAYAPGTMLLSEANQWPEDVRPYFGNGDEFHMNFHFPLMPRIFMALAGADRTPIEQILARTPALPSGCQWAIFLRCHDELTLEMVTPEERAFMWEVYAPDPRMRLNLGIRRRLAPLLGNDRRRIELANSLLLTLPGSPVIYYGDEIGMGDNIWLDDRDGVRTPMQWDGSQNGGFSTATVGQLYAPLVAGPGYGYESVNVAAQRAEPGSLLNRMREMVHVRKECPAFGRGDFALLAPAERAVLAYVRSYGDERVLVANNLSAGPRVVELCLDFAAKAQMIDLFTGERLAPVARGCLRLELGPHAYRWIPAAGPPAGHRGITTCAETFGARGLTKDRAPGTGSHRMDQASGPAWVATQAQISLERLLPRLEAQYGAQDPAAWPAFRSRLRTNFRRLFALLLPLYGGRYDFFYHLESILGTAARLWLARPADLKALDDAREAAPHWFQSQAMLGGVCYVNLFAGNLAGVRARIPYFKELGLSYLHLMPLFAVPMPENDGGYAVSSYREVNPAFGTMPELAALAGELRQEGISLVLDFVFNHTSDEHEWAQRALAGDPEYQDYYFLFPDRQMPDAYEKNLREIFPEVRQGSFTYLPDVHRWVWTTFNSYQWDLNYANPAVFNRMAEEMLFLANQGVEVLRLDAVAFIWKQMGTSCENLPEAHMLIQAFNILARIAAPALLFKSEAIVHPDEVAKYIAPGECQLSYNPLLMALLWESLATREVRLLQRSMQERFKLPRDCAWVNYVRCHDDIGWTFDDGDAARVRIDGYGHRQFLNRFYTGRFAGSYARGLPFQENPRTGDCRISGTCASLAGLEKALHEETADEVELAVRRILLIHSIILSIGGIPLLYLGDEVATLNDYSYRRDPAKAGDSRWVHRPFMDWNRAAGRGDPATLEGRVFCALRHMISVRKGCGAFAGSATTVIDSDNGHVFGYLHRHDAEQVLILANFSEDEQTVAANILRTHGLGYAFDDLINGETISCEHDLVLAPYHFVWLVAKA